MPACSSSLSARRAWIEIKLPKTSRTENESLSARRAWIEIRCRCQLEYIQTSLSARRAWIEIETPKEQAGKRAVALRKESVDRNLASLSAVLTELLSLSARRAWIEMPARGSVKAYRQPSLSARRAWIEIIRSSYNFFP